MIICPNCSKDNEDRHRFCLGCGARLPPDAAATPPAPGPGPGPGPGTEGWAPPPPGLAATPPPPPPTGSSRSVPPPPPSTGRGSGRSVPPPPPGRSAGGPPPPPGTGSAASHPPAPPSAPPSARSAPPPASAGPATPEGYTTCSSCAFSNPPGFAFCGRCGTSLAATPPAPPAGAQARTVFVQDAPEQLEQLRGQGSESSVTTSGTSSARPTDSIPVVASPAPAPPVSSPRPAVPGPSPTPTGATAAARLIMLGPDGTPIGERVLAAGETLAIGRIAGPPWDEDAYLDGEHGALTPYEEGIQADDYDSLNGIYVKLVGRVEIHHGDQFRVGQELLRYEDLPEPTPTEDGTERMGSPNPGYWGRLSLMVEPEVASQGFAIEGEGITIGRESGDITFPHDGYVSGSHCHVVGDDTGVYIEDLGSSNGTYMRVRSGAVLPYGSLVLIGQKLFQFERA